LRAEALTRHPVISVPLVWARAVPVWAWLTALVLVSAAVRFQLARGMVAPWIFVDELIYSELAKSFAATGHFAVRGKPVGLAFGFVYPVLISPAWRAFGSIPQAYAAAKAINSLVMSLAAVPAYFLARRMVGQWLALLAALLAVAIPSLVYTGTLMTENAFYPLFLATVLALVAYLERPTWRNGAFLLAALFFSFETRTQAVALVPAILTAPILLSLLDRRRLRGLADYRWLYAIVGGLVVLVFLAQAARGRSPLAVLGVYESSGSFHYRAADVARWFVYHAAELDLYVGIVPFAAFVALAGVAPRLPRAHRAFVAATIPVVAFLLLAVAAFATHPDVLRIEERNMFYLAPLLLIGLVAWIDAGAPRPLLAAGAGAVAAAALPGAIPFERLINVPAISDTLSLLPWWRLQDTLITLPQVQPTVVVGAIVAALLFLVVPRRAALVLPLLVLCYFALEQDPIESSAHGVRQASVGSLFQGITNPHRDWIDRAVGRGANVTVVTPGTFDRRFTVWQNEFFNRSVDAVDNIGPEPLPGNFPETRLTLDRSTGLLRGADGKPARAGYVLADASTIALAGTRITADDGRGMVLLRVNGPLRTESLVDGLYPGDTWSGRTARYTRFGCTGGTVAVTLQSDEALFSGPNLVTARVDDRPAGRASVPPTGETVLTVPLRPRDGRCVVEFTVGRTAVPAQVTNGANTDTRGLGAHFLDFAYSPPR
jgi:4-amino-4-deoxy-L-arabinose transferase-like glycosyltransferase